MSAIRYTLLILSVKLYSGVIQRLQRVRSNRVCTVKAFDLDAGEWPCIHYPALVTR